MSGLIADQSNSPLSISAWRERLVNLGALSFFSGDFQNAEKFYNLSLTKHNNNLSKIEIKC